MPHPWPDDFVRIPDDDWTRQPLGELALKYDTVETHGWYSNLERTVEQLDGTLEEGSVLVDYSGGTGILTRRLFERIGERSVGVAIVDASPKFLRLALDRLGEDARVAFRHLRWLREDKRLELLDEVLPAAQLGGRADVLSSTNAIHLYYHLPETLAAWTRVLRPGAPAFVQSGNIRNPDASPGDWIIDETVEAIHEAAVRLVREGGRWRSWKRVLDDEGRMAAHQKLRRKYFLPVRPLSFYVDALGTAGFDVRSSESRRIEARVDEWFEFLSAYHEGVLGWVGGSTRIEGSEPSESAVSERLELIRESMEVVFEGAPSFPCCWTYLGACAPS